MKTLSVIIPNYNKSKYLKQCIDSILNQTFIPNEIIVVDDASIDNSHELLEQLGEKESRIKLVFLPQNCGVSHARNEGLRHATSEYVTFIDADDFYFNARKLENEMELVEKGKGDVIAYSKLIHVAEDGSNLSWKPFPNRLYLEGNLYYRYLVGDFEFATIARDYIVRKRAIEAVGGYNEARSLYEDLELLIKLSQKCKLKCTYEIGTAYRYTGIGLSQKTEKECKIALRKIRDEFVSSAGRAKRWSIFFASKCALIKKVMRIFRENIKSVLRRIISVLIPKNG